MSYSALNPTSSIVPGAFPAPDTNPFDLLDQDFQPQAQLPPEKPKCLNWTLDKEAQFQSGLAVSTKMCLWFIALASLSLILCMARILWGS